MESEYGKQMFGRHDLPASVGITGSIELVSLEGPMCELALTGKFWHKRGTYSYLSIDISFLLIFGVNSNIVLPNRYVMHLY